MKIVVMVPARGGSKGIKDKNLQLIGENSLVQRTLIQSLNSKKIDAIVVSSDSINILENVSRVLDIDTKSCWKDSLAINAVSLIAGAPNPVYFHFRNIHDSGDKSLIGKTIKDLNGIFSEIFQDEIAILMLQPTTPFRKRYEIDDFITSCTTTDKVECAVSVRKVEDTHPARMYTLTGSKLKHLGLFEEYQFAPRQELPDVYLRDGAFYMIPHDQCKLEMPVSAESRFFIREYPYTINIDSSQDLVLAREEFESLPELRSV
jgi:CMP-N-acetylneuraminic acid synthetase